MASYRTFLKQSPRLLAVCDQLMSRSRPWDHRSLVAFSTSSVASSTCETCGCIKNSCEDCRIPRSCHNCSSCCCDASHQSWRLSRIRKGIRIEYFSSGWMTIEVLGSIGGGLIAGSFALLAFGGDSLIELISGLAVLGGLRKDSSRRSGDETHGKKTEQITSALLFALIPVIGLGAVISYLTGL